MDKKLKVNFLRSTELNHIGVAENVEIKNAESAIAHVVSKAISRINKDEKIKTVGSFFLTANLMTREIYRGLVFSGDTDDEISSYIHIAVFNGFRAKGFDQCKSVAGSNVNDHDIEYQDIFAVSPGCLI